MRVGYLMDLQWGEFCPPTWFIAVHPGSEWVMEGPEVERSKVLNVETVGTLGQGLFGGWISAS